MKGINRIMAFILAAVLSFSSFFWPALASADAETGKNREISEEQKTEELKKVHVTVIEGKGSIQIKDEEGNVREATLQKPLTIDCPAESFWNISVIPESGYQVAFYKTMTDTGEVREEITSPILEDGYYTAEQVCIEDVSSIEAGFTEAVSEQSEETDNSQESKNSSDTAGKVITEDKEKQTFEADQTEKTENNSEGNEIPAEEPDERFNLSEKVENFIASFSVSRELNLLAPRESIYMETGGRVYYYDYYTHWFKVDDRYAYCLEPKKSAPSSGYYETTAMGEGLLRKAMYYVLGGPGYEIYTSTFGNLGSVNWNEESEYTMSHCIVSYCYTGDMDAFFGTPDDLKDALMWEIGNIESLPDPPGSFEAFYFNMDGSGQTMGGCWDLQNGSIELKKSSASPEMTENNAAYSLSEAEYGIYIQGTEEQIAVLVTDEKGYARADDIPEGNYDIRELKAPAGYALDSMTGTVTVTGGQTVTYSCQDNPQSAPVKVLLEKIDQDKSHGSASMADAEFAVKYYKGFYDTDPARQGIKPERTWVMKTNENGVALLDESAKVSGDDFYHMTNGDPALPLGTVTIQETKAPTGYLINNELFIRQITSEGTAEAVATYNQPVVPETPQKGVIQLQKTDSEKNTSQGQASLDGAIYEIRNSSKEVIGTMTTDHAGKAESEHLPLGTYTVKEKTASPGYQIDPQTYTVNITAEDTTTEVFYKSVTSKEEIICGGVAVEKWDSEKDKREPQGSASLDGTQIQIISQNDQEILVDGKTYKKGQVITTLTTDKDGKASTEADYLPYGSYQLKEIKQPEGYTSAGTTVRNFEIRENGQIVQMNTSETAIKNKVIRGGVSVEKWDSELNKSEPLGGATLEGAQIQIISQNNNTVLVGGKEYKKGEVVATLTTDKDGKAGTAADLLPYGDYQLKENVSPTGYTSGGTIARDLEIREDGKIVQMTDTENAIKNEVIRGGVTIAKWSLETNERKTQGGATLSGAKFTVTNRSAKAVLVDGQMFQPGEVIATVETGEDGLWTSAKDWLPYGTYEIVEVQEPDGYLPDGAESKTFQIREDGKIVSLDNNERAMKNQVKRGDLNFVKVADGTLERLANVPFKITSKTTGESHIVVSDRNGQVDTSSAWNLHSQNTNRGETWEDGVWFSGTTEKEVPVNDEKGALPYDTYLIEEQRCEANEGDKLLSIEITVYRDNYTIPLGTLTDDNDLVEITTTAIDSDTEDHYVVAGENTTIIDTVEYTNLTKGEKYTLKGTLMNKAIGEPVTDEEGNSITAEKTFTAKKVNGRVELEFTFDSRKLAGADVVVFEELYQKENLIAEHTDITDEDQTIHFPEIGTKAMDQEINTNVSKADQEITLADTVSYSNLQPGKKYKLTGTLMDKETGEPVKDAEGKEITAEISFKPESSDGTVNVTFTFDGSNLAGKTIVVFESLERNDNVYALHTDIHDQAQTIYFPEIRTTVKDAVSGTQFGAAGEVTLVDTVSYSNLTPGTEYTLKGILMDQKTGESVKVGGQEVTAETTFKPEKTSGTIEVTFAFDASSLAGHTLVVFEELFQTEASIAEHKDITDEGQTIYIPEIGTTALDQESGTHNSNPDSKVTIVDTVTYKGLIPGKEYTVKGTLMDKSTGEELLADGKSVTAEKTFTAEKAEGSVELTFVFDGSALTGKTVVAFEHMYYEDKEVGSHTDIEDENQSIYFPAIGTTAKDSDTKDHIAKADKVTIIDTVSYQNLISGQKYTLKGVLMDKETGKELLISEKKVTAEKTFTPKAADGSVDLEYTFDASDLDGRQVVVFEELYMGDKLIGEHKDIQDEGQTVTFPQLHTNAADGITGNHTGTVNGKATVMDTVTYKGLLRGKEYTVKGTLMNKETGEPVKDSEGKEIIAEKTFTAEKAEGSVKLVYKLDSTLLAGQTVVVFEDLLYNSIKVGSHADINDEDQSVHYPDLEIQVMDKKTGIQKRGTAQTASVKTGDDVPFEEFFLGLVLSGIAIAGAIKKIRRKI